MEATEEVADPEMVLRQVFFPAGRGVKALVSFPLYVPDLLLFGDSLPIFIIRFTHSLPI